MKRDNDIYKRIERMISPEALNYTKNGILSCVQFRLKRLLFDVWCVCTYVQIVVASTAQQFNTE